MKKKSVIALFILTRLFSFGQVIYFDKVFDYQNNIETGGSIVQTTDTGYLFAEQVITINYRGLRFIKTNKYGDTLWSKMYSQTNFAFYDGASSNAITSTLDGKYIIAGFKTDVPSNATDAWLIKLNSNGDTIWTKTFASPYYDAFAQIIQNTDSSFVMAGVTSKFSSGADGNMWLIKTDKLGNLIWEKNYGGNGGESTYSISKTSDGGYILAGFTNSYGAGSFDFYIVKVDSNGSFQWQKTLGGPNGDVATGIIECAAGGYIVSGAYSISGNNRNGYIAKLNSAGNLVWSKQYGQSSMDDFRAKTVELSDGSLISIGTLSDTFSPNIPNGWVIKMNSVGDTLWTKKYRKWDIDSYFSDLKHTIDNGFVIAGYAFNSAGFDGNQDMWVLKLDSNGCENINCLPSGIVNTQSDDFTFTIYPNPSSGIFTIAFNNNLKDSQLVIYDVLGKIIFQSEISSKAMEVDLSNASTGIYFVSVTSENKRYSAKVVKQ